MLCSDKNKGAVNPGETERHLDAHAERGGPGARRQRRAIMEKAKTQTVKRPECWSPGGVGRGEEATAGNGHTPACTPVLATGPAGEWPAPPGSASDPGARRPPSSSLGTRPPRAWTSECHLLTIAALRFSLPFNEPQLFRPLHSGSLKWQDSRRVLCADQGHLRERT